MIEAHIPGIPILANASKLSFFLSLRRFASERELGGVLSLQNLLCFSKANFRIFRSFESYS
ncbi:hypothetical protein LEP1GSC051_2751 [Leptospira sp. P2653]|nr:hypothetical protein LEP1GSC051_2751 [Leptospira sp. P2653]